MSETPANVSPFYQGWDVYQDLLIKAIAPLSAEQWFDGSRPLSLLPWKSSPPQTSIDKYSTYKKDKPAP